MAGFEILVLSPDERALKWLNSDEVEIEETQSTSSVKSIRLTLPIREGDSEFKTLFRMGNKIYIPDSDVTRSCLYVINTQYSINYWKENTIDVEAEEVLVELNYAEPFYHTGDKIRVVPQSTEYAIRSKNLRAWFGDHYSIGTIQDPPSEELAYIEPCGSMTKMELLNYIEEQTGNKFTCWYVLSRQGNTSIIIRFLDFLNPDFIGHTHEATLDLGYNTDCMEYEVDESDTYKGIAPLISATEDKTGSSGKSTSANSLTSDDVAVIINDWVNLEVKQGETIPKTAEKYTEKNSDGSESEEKIRYTEYWESPFLKNKGDFFIYDEVDSAVEYGLVYGRQDAENMTITPKIGHVSTSESDKYSIFTACAEELIEKRYPQIDLSVDAYNLQKELGGENFFVWDKVYMKVPSYDMYFLGRVTETKKNPHLPGQDKITISNCKDLGRSALKTTYFDITDTTVVYGTGTYFKGKLYTRYEDELGKITVEPLADTLISITFSLDERQETVSSGTTTSSGSSYLPAGASVVVCSDNIFNKTKDKQNIADCVSILNSRGYKATAGTVNSNAHYNNLPSVGNGGVLFHIVGGLCAGTFVDLASNSYQKKLKAKNAKFVLGCMSPPITRQLDTMTWLERAHDDNFSPSSFKGLSNPGQYLKNAGINYVYGSNGTELGTKVTGGSTSSTTTTAATGESIDSIMREASTITYKSPSCSPSCANVDEGYECVRKNRVADCFGMSAYLYRRLNDNGHRARIVVYYSPYAGSGTHRSVQVYQNNAWKDVSYTGFDWRFKAMSTKKNMSVCKDAPAETSNQESTTKSSTTTTSLPAWKKTYNLRTDANGEFKIQINLASETYGVKCSYGGNTEYESSSSSVNLVVAPRNTTSTVVASATTSTTTGGNICKKLSELTGVAINSIDTLYKAFMKTNYKYYYNDIYSQSVALNRIKQGLGLNCVDSNQLAYVALKELGVNVRICNGTVYCSRSYGHIWCEINTGSGWTVFDASAAAKGRSRGLYICGTKASRSQINPSWLLSDDGKT